MKRMVRIGSFSRLTDLLRQIVVDQTEHSIKVGKDWVNEDHPSNMYRW